ncbi:unnamed protein product [Amoebophrya sp. A120]|nr:unnamed protein product [Amoebophrya sp. A120]|eukprot:GSA120T00010381001.1
MAASSTTTTLPPGAGRPGGAVSVARPAVAASSSSSSSRLGANKIPAVLQQPGRATQHNMLMAARAANVSKNSSSSNSGPGLEKLTIADLQGMWLHSNQKLGLVTVTGNTAKLATLPQLHVLTEVGDTVEMHPGWRADLKASSNSEITWRSTKPGNSIFCTWQWEGADENDVVSASDLLKNASKEITVNGRVLPGLKMNPQQTVGFINNQTGAARLAAQKRLQAAAEKVAAGAAASSNATGGPKPNPLALTMALDHLLPAKRVRRPVAEAQEAFDFVIRNPTVAGGAGSDVGGKKRRKKMNGGDRDAEESQTSRSDERDSNLTLEAVREWKTWMFSTNTLEWDAWYTGGSKSFEKKLSVKLRVLAQKEELIRLMQQKFGVRKESITFDELGAPSIATGKKMRENFAKKFSAQWSTKLTTATGGCLAPTRMDSDLKSPSNHSTSRGAPVPARKNNPSQHSNGSSQASTGNVKSSSTAGSRFVDPRQYDPNLQATDNKTALEETQKMLQDAIDNQDATIVKEKDALAKIDLLRKTMTVPLMQSSKIGKTLSEYAKLSNVSEAVRNQIMFTVSEWRDTFRNQK